MAANYSLIRAAIQIDSGRAAVPQMTRTPQLGCYFSAPNETLSPAVSGRSKLSTSSSLRGLDGLPDLVSAKFRQKVARFRLYRLRFLQENMRLDSLVLEILLSPQRRGRKIEGGCKVEGAKQRGGAKLIPQRRGGVQR